MKIIQSSFQLNKKEYFETHLSIVNVLLPIHLSSVELEILAAFIGLDKSVTDNGYFNPLARKIVLKELSISAASLSNHLKSLLKKGFLYKNDISKIISIQNYLLPEVKEQGYQIKIIRNEIDK